MGLRDFINAMRARFGVVILAAAVVALVAVGISLLSPPSYQGEATLLLTQQNTGAALAGSPQQDLTDVALQREVQTQVSVMQSRVILERVISALHLDTTPAALLRRVSVKFDGNTNIVTIDAVDSSPQRAAKIANSLADTYVAWSLQRERASIQTAADDVQQRLALAQQQIVAIQAAISAGDGSVAKQVQLQAANSQYGTLADKLEQLKVSEQLETGSGSVLTTAVPNPAPVAPKPVRNAALGLAVGLVLGLCVVFVAQALDNTIKSPDEAEEVYEAPVLCNIPEEKHHKKSEVPRLTLLENPDGPAAEAYRVLRNNLGFVNFEHEIKTVLVTSALPSEGKSTVAANLAACLARTGKNVVLVCCDFHRPGAAAFFGISNKLGLSDVLGGAAKVSEVLLERAPGFESLWVVPAGRKPPNPSELLGSSAMGNLITSLRETSDWVILDSPPLLAVADAAAAAPWADGVLVVTHAKVSTRDDARRGREQLRNVGARILGVAFWGLELAGARGGYFSGYGASTSE